MQLFTRLTTYKVGLNIQVQHKSSLEVGHTGVLSRFGAVSKTDDELVIVFMDIEKRSPRAALKTTSYRTTRINAIKNVTNAPKSAMELIIF